MSDENSDAAEIIRTINSKIRDNEYRMRSLIQIESVLQQVLSSPEHQSQLSDATKFAGIISGGFDGRPTGDRVIYQIGRAHV